MNILIPMGGIGHRFSQENYRFPKPLIKIVGRPMLFWLLDNLDTKDDDIIYIGLMESLEKQFDVTQTLKTEYPTRIFEFILIDFETRGAAETLFIILQSMHKDRLERKTISLDCDTIYLKPIIEKFRQLPNDMNASFFFEDNGGKPIYSYLKFDENSERKQNLFVTDVCEKIMISSHANTGAYAFRSASILKEYCIQLLDEAVGHSGEYYTTHIIKLMLNKQEIFVGIEVNFDDFVCVGTPDQLNQFLNKLKSQPNPIKTRKMRFCFDLDNTLVSYPTKHGDYNSVEPKTQNIQLIRELHSAGHYIIIQTARRMKTHKGNVGAVIADIGRITLETLTKFDIPYDELIFGKPYADVYIDDAAIHALIDTAKEIGWSLDNTIENCQIKKPIKGFISSRHFHTIEQLDNLIIKSSSTDCLQGEIYFYQNIPSSILDLFPKLNRIETNNDAAISSIIMERIKGVTFSHLFTNLCLTDKRLTKLLLSLKRIHQCSSKDSQELKKNIYANYSNKMFSRFNQFIEIYQNLDKYFQSSMIRSEELMNNIIKYLDEYEKYQRGQHTPIIHGDPVFTNMLLTSDGRVIFLDMRGSLGTQLTLQGDLNYDLAKVYQSLIGYDFVLLNKFHLLSSSTIQTYLFKLIQTFQHFISTEYSTMINFNDIQMITAHLFFSLIPLHDNFQHQIQFYKLAARLYHQAIVNKH
jgi:capsule biosynthesis phosphatase